MQNLDVEDLSNEFEASPRVVRRFLREHTPKGDRPGRGHRWEIPEDEFPQLKKLYTEWSDVA